MAHNHHHGHQHDTENISTAFFLNLTFTIIEIIGGLLTNSVAIMSDALHDLGDSLSLGLAWYFQKVAKKGRDETFSYGYKRFSVLGAMINALVLIIGSVFILQETIPRLLQPQTPNVQGMFWLAILGIVVNGAAVFKLKKGTSLNEKVISLHLLEDVLGWAAVLVGSILMYFFDLPIIDPLLSIGIAIFILINVYQSLKTALNIVLQAVPTDFNIKKMKTDFIHKYPKIQSIHDVHTWTMDGEYNILTMHIVLNDNHMTSELQQLKKDLRHDLEACDIQHATIEFEMIDEDCELVDC
jgi:cobalt-zinc-cadmium efflux system protein